MESFWSFYNLNPNVFLLGGSYLEVGDEKCTHMVVEENSVKELPFVPSKRLYVVKQEVSTSVW